MDFIRFITLVLMLVSAGQVFADSNAFPLGSRVYVPGENKVGEVRSNVDSRGKVVVLFFDAKKATQTSASVSPGDLVRPTDHTEVDVCGKTKVPVHTNDVVLGESPDSQAMFRIKTIFPNGKVELETMITKWSKGATFAQKRATLLENAAGVAALAQPTGAIRVEDKNFILAVQPTECTGKCPGKHVIWSADMADGVVRSNAEDYQIQRVFCNGNISVVTPKDRILNWEWILPENEFYLRDDFSPKAPTTAASQAQTE